MKQEINWDILVRGWVHAKSLGQWGKRPFRYNTQYEGRKIQYYQSWAFLAWEFKHYVYEKNIYIFT